jgi:predicted amidohydrolase
MFETEEECFLEIETLIKTSLSNESDCDLFCLPERWIKINQNLEENIQNERGKHYQFVKTLASRYKINLLSGGIWEKREVTGKNYITCYYFNKNGDEMGRQDKIHLYLYEKHFFEPGDHLNLFNINDTIFSILICFDMVFDTPKLAVKNGAEILISPTLIREEGLENWGIYLRAKALENRVPIAACNAYGIIEDRIFPGNSKIITFEKGYYSPSKLEIIEAPLKKHAILTGEIETRFPNKLRKKRFKEAVNLDKIKISKI